MFHGDTVMSEITVWRKATNERRASACTERVYGFTRFGSAFVFALAPVAVNWLWFPAVLVITDEPTVITPALSSEPMSQTLELSLIPVMFRPSNVPARFSQSTSLYVVGLENVAVRRRSDAGDAFWPPTR